MKNLEFINMKLRQDPILAGAVLYFIYSISLSIFGIDVFAFEDNFTEKYGVETITSFINANPDLKYLPSYVSFMLMPIPLLVAISCYCISKKMKNGYTAYEKNGVLESIAYVIFGCFVALFLIYFSLLGVKDLSSPGFRGRMALEFFSTNRVTVGLFYFINFWGAQMFVGLSFLYLVRAFDMKKILKVKCN